MRWPIQAQLLLPMLPVVVLAIALASAATSYLQGERARRQQEESLQRVVSTLAAAGFPLSGTVLRQMRGLSGAEFVLLNPKGQVEQATLRLDSQEVAPLGQLAPRNELVSLSARPVVVIGGRRYLNARVAVRGPVRASQLHSLVVLYPEDVWWESIREAALPALLVGAVAAGAVVLVATVLARRFVRPVRQVVRQAAAIASGDFRPVAVPRRNDELRELAEALNRMASRLEQYESDIRRNERLRTLGQLGAGMAHQLRNAATGAMMALELHEREDPAASQGEALEVARRQLRLMESYLQRFLSLGRPSSTPRQPLSLEGVVDDALCLVGPTCRHARMELVFVRPETPMWIEGEAESLRQLLVNLLLNAIEAASKAGAARGRVVVELCRVDDLAVVRVKDSGPGPADVVRAGLFEPFVTEKPEGTGLGLFVARQIAEAHGGTIGWRRVEDMTCFEVALPVRAEKAS